MTLRWLCSLLLCGLATAQADDGKAPDLVIVHFNDFHGQIHPRAVVSRPGRPAIEMGGFATLAHFVVERRRRHGERLWLTNGGDWFQGTPEGNEDRGVGVLACLDSLGVTASVLGNHEYDFGERQLIELVERARHPILAANVLERGSERLRPYVRPYVVRSVAPRGGGDAVRIAIVGLVTADTPSVSTGPFGSAAFAPEESVLERLWPALQRDADVTILLTHCGLSRDRELARAFPQIPLILGGHSHTELRKPLRQGDTWIVQSGSRAAAVTEVAMAVSAKGLAVLWAEYRDLPTEGGVDAAAAGFADMQFAGLSQQWDSPLGIVEGAPDRRRGAMSTPGGSFMAALIRRAGDADIGLMNKGGLRTALAAGEITRRQVFEFAPFDNTVVTMELTGDELAALLAAGLVRGRQPLEIDGAHYRYEVKGGERRLLDIRVGGEPLEPSSRYRVATNSFLAGGGDGMVGLRDKKRLTEKQLFLRDLIVAHLGETGKITLPADNRIRANGH